MQSAGIGSNDTSVVTATNGSVKQTGKEGMVPNRSLHANSSMKSSNANLGKPVVSQQQEKSSSAPGGGKKKKRSKRKKSKVPKVFRDIDQNTSMSNTQPPSDRTVEYAEATPEKKDQNEKEIPESLFTKEILDIASKPCEQEQDQNQNRSKEDTVSRTQQCTSEHPSPGPPVASSADTTQGFTEPENIRPPKKRVSFSLDDQLYAAVANGDAQREKDLESVPLESPIPMVDYYGLDNDKEPELVCHEFLVGVELLNKTNSVVVQDWLRVRTDEGDWISKWALLHNNVLYLFPSYDAERPCSVAILDQIMVEDGPGNELSPFVFRLHSRNGRILYLQTDSTSMKTRWIELLSSHSYDYQLSLARRAKKKHHNHLAGSSEGATAAQYKPGRKYKRAPSHNNLDVSSMMFGLLMMVQVLLQVSLDSVFFVCSGNAKRPQSRKSTNKRMKEYDHTSSTSTTEH